jgi:hypothetical protein
MTWDALPLKEQLDVILTAIGVIGGLIAAFVATLQFSASVREKQRELRWRQAREGKAIVDELRADVMASNAMKMLDWGSISYDDNGRKTIPITSEVLLEALRTEKTLFNADERFVRDCFDSLFDRYERIEQFISNGLIRFEDVQAPVGYFVRLMAKRRSVFGGFLQKYGYVAALRLCEHFDEWRNAVT